MREYTSVSFPVTASQASLSFFPGGNMDAGGAAVWTASGWIRSIAVPYDPSLSIETVLHIYDAYKVDGTPMDSGGKRHLVTVASLLALNGNNEAYGRAVTGTLDGTNRKFSTSISNVTGTTVPSILVPIDVYCPMGMVIVMTTPAGIGANRFLSVVYAPQHMGGTRRKWSEKNFQYVV